MLIALENNMQINISRGASDFVSKPANNLKFCMLYRPTNKIKPTYGFTDKSACIHKYKYFVILAIGIR